LLKKALEEIGLRGGGSPSMAQGQLPAADLDTLTSRLEAVVRSESAAAI
jgi:alanyl-tRNA synthetase